MTLEGIPYITRGADTFQLLYQIQRNRRRFVLKSMHVTSVSPEIFLTYGRDSSDACEALRFAVAKSSWVNVESI